jgi:hypothetical protein
MDEIMDTNQSIYEMWTIPQDDGIIKYQWYRHDIDTEIFVPDFEYGQPFTVDGKEYIPVDGSFVV